jgi:hypothetical protein
MSSLLVQPRSKRRAALATTAPLIVDLFGRKMVAGAGPGDVAVRAGSAGGRNDNWRSGAPRDGPQLPATHRRML